MVIDVRADQRLGDRDAAVFAATAQVCAQVGWGYQRAGELGPVHVANLRWLSGLPSSAVRSAGAGGPAGGGVLGTGPAAGGGECGGDSVAVLPVLFGMLWRGELATDVECELLSAATRVMPAAAGRASGETARP